MHKHAGARGSTKSGHKALLIPVQEVGLADNAPSVTEEMAVNIGGDTCYLFPEPKAWLPRNGSVPRLWFMVLDRPVAHHAMYV